jgi:hypothetical protein
MRTLDVQMKLAFASAGVSVLRALKFAGMTMTYGDFADAVGLMHGDDGWQPWHRSQVSDILNLMAAAAGSKRSELDFSLIHDKKGQHGKGLRRKVKIVRTD